MGPCGWWAEPARVARWFPESGDPRDVLAWVGPELDHPDHARALERAAQWIGRRDEGVLPLLGVVPLEGRTAWLYEPRSALSLGTVLAASPDGLPHRAAIELTARVAEILEGLGPAAVGHPGPEPDHVLLKVDGEVLLAGFTGPSPRSPARREPRGRDDAEALVWRLGVLLAELLTGSPAAPATDRASHETALRRLVIRAMSRPGPAFPDRCRHWLEALLAWEAASRPVLGRVAPGLRDLARGLPGDDLAAWAAATVPPLRARTAGLDSLRPPEPPMHSGAILLPEVRPDQTEEVLRVRPILPQERDDPTQISTDATPTPVHERTTGLSEHGAIPVGVGPPVEVARKQPTLPRQLFDTSGQVELPTEPEARGGRLLGLEPPVFWTLVMLGVAMLVAAVLVGAWLSL